MNKMNEKINQAFTYFDNGELDKAEQIYRECLREVQDKKSQEYRNILHGLGYVKSHNNDFDGARKIYMELIEIAQSTLNKKFEAIALHQLGMVERLAKNFNEALLLFQNEQQMLEKYFPDFFVGMSANFYEQGMIFLNKGSFLKYCCYLSKVFIYTYPVEKVSPPYFTEKRATSS
ncbi:tetratricopeptide repeat protein [Heyndrickxia sp. FSL W8-0496]|uniref:tetratricopeptide repeat protein n=1 Tax=Heyndrickxia TaxID=2837504 RepID=UPI0030F59E0E